MDMFVVFTGSAATAQDTIFHQLSKEQDDIEFLEIPTKCCSNHGAIAETISEEK